MKDRVELLARELFEIQQDTFMREYEGCKDPVRDTWEDCPERWKEDFRCDARRILDALGIEYADSKEQT